MKGIWIGIALLMVGCAPSAAELKAQSERRIAESRMRTEQIKRSMARVYDAADTLCAQQGDRIEPCVAFYRDFLYQNEDLIEVSIRSHNDCIVRGFEGGEILLRCVQSRSQELVDAELESITREADRARAAAIQQERNTFMLYWLLTR